MWKPEEAITSLNFVLQSELILDKRMKKVYAPTSIVYQCFTGIGDSRGWYYATILWEVRGLIDRLLGGVGLRRGRRHPDNLRVGDALDFWRVEAVKPNQLIRLRAEMKVPGTAWLQFRSMPHIDGTTLLEQAVIFAPKGLFGLIYWYSLYPIHRWIFKGLIKQIARRAEESCYQNI